MGDSIMEDACILFDGVKAPFDKEFVAAMGERWVVGDAIWGARDGELKGAAAGAGWECETGLRFAKLDTPVDE